MTFSQYRIIIEVFRSFGLLISGNWKHKSFTYDFQVNHLYIQALLFELELRLGIYLNEETLESFCCPQSIVAALSAQSQIRGVHSSEVLNAVNNIEKEMWG